MLVNEDRCNTKTISLRSPGAVLTLACSNLFEMSKADRQFILGLLEKLERYEEERRAEMEVIDGD